MSSMQTTQNLVISLCKGSGQAVVFLQRTGLKLPRIKTQTLRCRCRCGFLKLLIFRSRFLFLTTTRNKSFEEEVKENKFLQSELHCLAYKLYSPEEQLSSVNFLVLVESPLTWFSL